MTTKPRLRPPLAYRPSSASAHPMEKLAWVMAALRDPEQGCPWDLEQDFRSIAPYTLEEAYEVADAIDRQDMTDLREELGDLLFQSVYHAQMAAEAGHFTLDEVIEGITEKMISRHPHVFGEARAATAADVNSIWDERKKAEKAAATSPAGGERPGALDGVTAALPALLHAQKLTSRAAKTGFEWPTTARVLDKLQEELAELREAMDKGNAEEQAGELGDVLFVLANLGRMLGLNAEEALRQTNNKFIRRFNGMEKELQLKYQSLSDAPLDQMDQEWVRQKQKERTELS
jgi:nucleoside triphosphate diphosphatase